MNSPLLTLDGVDATIARLRKLRGELSAKVGPQTALVVYERPKKRSALRQALCTWRQFAAARRQARRDLAVRGWSALYAHATLKASRRRQAADDGARSRRALLAKGLATWHAFVPAASRRRRGIEAFVQRAKRRGWDALRRRKADPVEAWLRRVYDTYGPRRSRAARAALERFRTLGPRRIFGEWRHFTRASVDARRLATLGRFALRRWYRRRRRAVPRAQTRLKQALRRMRVAAERARLADDFFITRMAPKLRVSFLDRWRAYARRRDETRRRVVGLWARRALRKWNARATRRSVALALAKCQADETRLRRARTLVRRWAASRRRSVDTRTLALAAFRRATRRSRRRRSLVASCDAHFIDSSARRCVETWRRLVTRVREQRRLLSVARAARETTATRGALRRLATHAASSRLSRAVARARDARLARVAMSRLLQRRDARRVNRRNARIADRQFLNRRTPLATWLLFAAASQDRRRLLLHPHARMLLRRWRARPERRHLIDRARAFRDARLDSRARFLVPVAFHLLHTEARSRWAKRAATKLAAQRQADFLMRSVLRAWHTYVVVTGPQPEAAPPKPHPLFNFTRTPLPP